MSEEAEMDRCRHTGCGCTAEDGFCSDFCRQHGEGDHGHEMTADGSGCGCGHPECAAGA
jgi:hypothetical protein